MTVSDVCLFVCRVHLA